MTAPTRSPCRISRLLVAGASLHLVATASVFALGRFGVLPNMILPNGIVQGDGADQYERVVYLTRNSSALGSSVEQIHTRLYAISSVVLTPIVGANIFSIELISLPLYLLLLFLTYQIGRTCFEPRVGSAAAVAIGLLPTLLVHETQPVRDPLFIVLVLTFLWITVRLLKELANIIAALGYASGGFFTLLLMWLVRDSLWLVYVGVVTLALLALLAAAIKNKRVPLINFACLLFFLAALILMPKFFSTWQPMKGEMSTEEQQALDEFTARQIQGGQGGVILKISVMREKWVILYKDAGSNIDVNRTFRNATDVLVYSPRAILIGLFAPFPQYWFEKGAVFGLLGRLIAGLETGFIYLLTPFALAGLWRSRHSVHAWYLFAVVLLGAGALGLVVANMGALYRLRYSFWIVLIILGASYLSGPLTLNRAIKLIGRAKEHGA